MPTFGVDLYETQAEKLTQEKKTALLKSGQAYF
jgi:hypothetical protein